MWTKAKKTVFLMAVGLILFGTVGAIHSAWAGPGEAEVAAISNPAVADQAPSGAAGGDQISIRRGMVSVAKTTGIYGFMVGAGWKSLVMVLAGGLLLYLGVVKDFEPLLLVPIGFGTILVNVPFAGMGSEHGLLGIIFKYGIENELLPLIVFMGIGALSDFGPLLASPRVAILGAAAQ